MNITTEFNQSWDLEFHNINTEKSLRSFKRDNIHKFFILLPGEQKYLITTSYYVAQLRMMI